MNHVYKNPWAKSYEPQEYALSIEPFTHRGCQIFHVLPDQWDVVKNGACISQRAGKRGAMECAEVVEDMDAPTYKDVRERMFERFGHC